jgi:hypothetical protein
VFNDAGTANATAGFTFNKTSNLVNVTGNINSSGNIVATANLFYSGNILVARSLTVGTRTTPVTIPLLAGGNVTILTRSGNTNVQVTT